MLLPSWAGKILVADLISLDLGWCCAAAAAATTGRQRPRPPSHPQTQPQTRSTTTSAAAERSVPPPLIPYPRMHFHCRGPLGFVGRAHRFWPGCSLERLRRWWARGDARGLLTFAVMGFGGLGVWGDFAGVALGGERDGKGGGMVEGVAGAAARMLRRGWDCTEESGR